MLLTARRAALAAAASSTAAAALPSAAARSLAIVAGQDTPVRKDDLPEHIKAANTITQAPGSGASQGESATSDAIGAAASPASAEQRGSRHPGPKTDPYSGGDPSQQGQASSDEE
ncbi:hypothetical protein ABPG77_005603 [Micractinium sp. CCAP 211/92]